MGFDLRKAEEALAQYETVSNAVDALLAGKGITFFIIIIMTSHSTVCCFS